MIALLASAWATCPPVGPLLDSLERDLEDVRPAVAVTRLEQVHASLACGPPLEPTEAARLHAYTGVLATLQGDAERARVALSTAHQLAPDLDLSAFGPSLQATFRSTETGDEVPLTLEPPIGGARTAWIDGLPAGSTVFPGQHVLQITHPVNGTLYGAPFVARTGTPAVVPTGLAPEPRPVLQPEPRVQEPTPPVVAIGRPGFSVPLPPPEKRPEPVRPERSPVLPVVGTAVAAAGLATLAYSFERGAALKTAPDAATLDRRWRAHRASRVSGLGATVVGAGLLLVGVF